jgi:hypothetical protein
MAKDLIKPNKQDEPQQSKAHTEAERAIQSYEECLLFGVSAPPVPDRPRIILGLDCTSSMGEFIASRRITPEVAMIITKALFEKAPALEVQLVFFRGDGDKDSSEQPRQCRSYDEWYRTPEALAAAITEIEHWPGWTQHCRLLRHAVEEAKRHAVQEVVLVTDAFEPVTPRRPQGDDLDAACIHAQHLRALGTTLSVAFKGIIRNGCPLDRAGIRAEDAFRTLSEANGGYCFLLDRAKLTNRFAEIAERAAAVTKGEALTAQALLEHLRTIPFEMNVVGEQINAKCGHGDEGGGDVS